MNHKDLFLKIAAEGDTLEPNAAKPRGGFQARMLVDHAWVAARRMLPSLTTKVIKQGVIIKSSIPLLPQNPHPSDASNSRTVTGPTVPLSTVT